MTSVATRSLTPPRSSMNIEAILTRELGVRFIDARSLATEAKLNLGMEGYVAQEEHAVVLAEATRIYNQGRTDEQKKHMQILKNVLDVVKCSNHSHHTRGSVCGSEDGASSAFEFGEENDEETISTSGLTDERNTASNGAGKKRQAPPRRKSKDLLLGMSLLRHVSGGGGKANATTKKV